MLRGLKRMEDLGIGSIVKKNYIELKPKHTLNKTCLRIKIKITLAS